MSAARSSPPGAATIIHLLQSRADIYNLTGLTGRALRDVERTLIIARRGGDRNDLALCLLQLSDVHCTVGDLAAMRQAAIDALAIYQETGDGWGQSHSLINIGYAQDGLSNYRQALDYYGQALAIQERIGDREGQAQCLNNIGYVHDGLGEYAAALDFYGRSLAIRGETGDLRGEANNLNNIGAVRYCLGEYRPALEHYRRSLAIQERIGDRWGQAYSLLNIGIVLSTLGDSGAALDHFGRSLSIREEIGDRSGQASARNSIGQINTELGDFPAARRQLARAEELARELSETELTRRVAAAMGALALAEGDIAQAREQAGAAERLAAELQSKAGRAEAMLLQARIDAAERSWPSAVAGFEQAISLYQKIKQPKDAAIVHYYYGVALAAMGDREKSGQCLARAREIFEQLHAVWWLKQLDGRTSQHNK